MAQDAQLRIGPSPDDDGDHGSLRGELAKLTLRVAHHVSAAATLVWLWLWDSIGFETGTTRVTLSSVAAVTGKSKKQAQRHLDELVSCGFVTKLNATDGCHGGIELRIEDVHSILAPGPSVVYGNSQRPLFDPSVAGPNVSQNAALPSHSAAPIIDHGARSNSSSIIGHRSSKVREESEMTNDHDVPDRHVRSGPSRSPADSDDTEVRRLAAEIKRRKREVKAHVSQHPTDADMLRKAIGNVVSEHDTAKSAAERTARHTLLCEVIVVAVKDSNMPNGLVHDVADLVVDGLVPERAITRILTAIRNRRPGNPGGYFRRCIESECRKRGVAPPQAHVGS